MSWKSDLEEVGSGSQEIVESVENRKVATALDFGEMGTADAAFLMEPEGTATKVTWVLDSELPLYSVARWMDRSVRIARRDLPAESEGRGRQQLELNR